MFSRKLQVSTIHILYLITGSHELPALGNGDAELLTDRPVGLSGLRFGLAPLHDVQDLADPEGALLHGVLDNLK